MKKIAITDCEHVSYEQEQAACAAVGVEFVKYDLKTEDEVIEQMQDYPAIGVQYVKFTKKAFDQMPNLKCLVRYGIGVDNIDIAEATKHGVAVCNVPDYSIQEVAAHAFAMMMALTRKLKVLDRSMARGEWNYEHCIPLRRYSEMTVGIIGAGRIGRAFAGMVHSLGCRVIAYDIAFPKDMPADKKAAVGLADYITLATLDEVLAQSDVLSLHSPLSRENSGALGAEQMQQMKDGAFLINVSRGGLVQEQALYEALVRGKLAGAACDTWEKEPTNADNPLLQLDNFIATPHMAWYSEESSKDLKRKVAEELLRALNGEPLAHQLNKF